MNFIKSLAVLPAFFVIPLLYNKSSSANITSPADSTIIEHHFDGLVNEWPAEKFTIDEDSKIRYMADNDSMNLYMALCIPNPGLQLKMARMGMKCYIDLKGKKKEGMGIEFPIKRETSGTSGGGMPTQHSEQQSNDQPGGFDPERMKKAMIIYMIQLKLFGFGEEEPMPQQLELNGSAQVAYNWDSAGMLTIEYMVPLDLIGKRSSLNQKTISLGWKINGAQSGGSAPPTIGTTATTSSRSARSRPALTAGSNFSQADIDKMMKEQNFWTKYTFNFTPAAKGF